MPSEPKLVPADLPAADEASPVAETSPAVDPAAAMRQRAQQCMASIRQVLDHFHCQIVPMVTTDQVGQGPGARVLIGATYAVIPQDG